MKRVELVVHGWQIRAHHCDGVICPRLELAQVFHVRVEPFETIAGDLRHVHMVNAGLVSQGREITSKYLARKKPPVTMCTPLGTATPVQEKKAAPTRCQ